MIKSIATMGCCMTAKTEYCHDIFRGALLPFWQQLVFDLVKHLAQRLIMKMDNTAYTMVKDRLNCAELPPANDSE
ncbi:hypothetical protein OUZ56_002018 [Daphnia magna]|uniref:Uncharacterized protein n=1 Tax=Daphnia magna TaxID=35525 RepID=A0ABR0A4G0_9CRUS|nr:hypothetical protein OUZ56_002018 [Daphnia magna]